MQEAEYTKMAEVEDQMWYFRSLHAHFNRELRAVGRSDRKLEVLDAGCGTGGMILRLRQANPPWRFAGIDFMPVACELARERCGHAVDIREASITDLPFADGSFDAVACADVISQVTNPEVAIREFFRVLRPGGVVVLNVAAYMWMWSYHDDTCETKHRFTRPEVAGLLGQAGFVDRRLTHWNAIPFPLIWARRKIFRTAADTSDVKLYPAPIEAMFNGVMAIEHAWMRGGGRWAWGTSIFAVARKSQASAAERHA